MSEIEWCIVLVALTLVILGSELSVYEDLKHTIKRREEEKMKHESQTKPSN